MSFRDSGLISSGLHSSKLYNDASLEYIDEDLEYMEVESAENIEEGALDCVESVLSEETKTVSSASSLSVAWIVGRRVDTGLVEHCASSRTDSDVAFDTLSLSASLTAGLLSEGASSLVVRWRDDSLEGVADVVEPPTVTSDEFLDFNAGGNKLDLLPSEFVLVGTVNVAETSGTVAAFAGLIL